jgi:hypothetical protein
MKNKLIDSGASDEFVLYSREDKDTSGVMSAVVLSRV